MPEQNGAAATRRLDERGKRIQPLPLVGTAVRLDLGFDPLARTREIFGAPEQPCLRGLAVAACAPCLLLISLNRFRDSGMGDEANVGLVDAHAERDRCRDHHVLRLHERGLIASANLRFQARMVRQ